jgi:putative hydrolase of the HAD superfamily
MSTLRAVILDYGEVLCLAPHKDEFEQMAALLGMDLPSFLLRYPAARLPYDQGSLTPAEYWSLVAPEGASVGADALRTLRRLDVDIYARVDPEMLAWIPRLRASGFKVGLLSNMPHDMTAFSRRAFRWLADLDACIFSCEHRLIKPSPAIYHLAVSQLGVRPEEALFIDDREVNTEAAQSAGLLAVRFESVGQLRGSLPSLGCPLLP